MTEPRKCPKCGRINCICSQDLFNQPASTRSLMANYVDLRRDCDALEQLIGSGVLEADESKRLDKAVTIMKVGFKMVKKVIRARGVTGRLKAVSQTVVDKETPA